MTSYCNTTARACDLAAKLGSMLLSVCLLLIGNKYFIKTKLKAEELRLGGYSAFHVQSSRIYKDALLKTEEFSCLTHS